MVTTGEVAEHERLSQRFTAPDLAAVLFQTYYVSQGSGILQNDLFRYARHRFPGLGHTPDSQKIEAVEMVMKKSASWVRNGPHTSRLSTLEIAQEESDLRQTLASPELADSTGFTEDALLGSIAKGITMRDYRWLVFAVGRPGRRAAATNDYHKPYLSHAMHYGVLGNTTRNPVMDDLLAGVGRTLPALYRQPDTREALPVTVGLVPLTATFHEAFPKVATVHAHRHPETSQALQQLLPGVLAQSFAAE
jgi:hypothetical protein